jgi:hypothetical protein
MPDSERSIFEFHGRVRNELPRGVRQVVLKASIYNFPGQLIEARKFLLTNGPFEPGDPTSFSEVTSIQHLPKNYFYRLEVVDAKYTEPASAAARDEKAKEYLETPTATPLLPPKQEIELAANIKKGDREARARSVDHYEDLTDAATVQAKKAEAEQRNVFSAATSSPLATRKQMYRIVHLPRGGELSVRANPRADSPVVAKLFLGAHVYFENERVQNGTITWDKITSWSGHTGWVNADYLALEK